MGRRMETIPKLGKQLGLFHAQLSLQPVVNPDSCALA